MLNDPSANPLLLQEPRSTSFAASELHQAITFAPIDRKNMNPKAAIKISCNNLIWVLIRKLHYPTEKKLNILMNHIYFIFLPLLVICLHLRC